MKKDAESYDDDETQELEVLVDRRIPQHAITEACDYIHAKNVEAGWWDGQHDLKGRATKIALIHSEVSEMLEGLRKDLPDSHLSHRPMEEVEAADIVIRLFDYCGERGFDLGGAVAEKMYYNAHREDHKREHREGEGGKKF